MFVNRLPDALGAVFAVDIILAMLQVAKQPTGHATSISEVPGSEPAHGSSRHRREASPWHSPTDLARVAAPCPPRAVTKANPPPRLCMTVADPGNIPWTAHCYQGRWVPRLLDDRGRWAPRLTRSWAGHRFNVPASGVCLMSALPNSLEVTPTIYRRRQFTIHGLIALAP